MGESILEFMERQRRKAERLGRRAEAVAHEAYREAIRAGQDLKLKSPGDVIRHGSRLIQKSEDRIARVVSGRIGEAKRQVDASLNRIGETPGVRSLAVGAVGSAGALTGVVRGGVHVAEGIADGAAFVSKLANPIDYFVSPPGKSAVEQVAKSGRNLIEYFGDAVDDPQSIVDDVKARAIRMRMDLDPTATPPARTFPGELRRVFEIGQNQGELAFDLGTLFVGGPAAKAVKGFDRSANVGNVQKYIAQGFSPRAAAHLAKLYPTSNMGSHFIPRRTKLPAVMGGGSLPRYFLDGPFNRLHPPDISRGDFYELHFSVDPKFYGTGVLGERWSGRDLRLKRYGPAGQIWHGSPAPLKARVGGLGASVGGAAEDLEGGDQAW
jgi:hypothetical protein